MDLTKTFETFSSREVLKCIDMHTTGEATRIVYSGFPDLQCETLLSKHDKAKAEYDHLHKQLMFEPRGHDDMYGAILIRDTECVRSGEAHMGTLFTHGGGFSTMCGHATIALGRFLVDTHDLAVFPQRNALQVDPAARCVRVNLHAPCGVVQVTVPTVDAEGRRSDPSRPVTFQSTPSYAAVVGLTIPIPEEVRWPELAAQGKDTITLDISYGGAFYALVDVRELGFQAGLVRVDLEAIRSAVAKLKAHLETQLDVLNALQHPEDPRLSFLYSVMVTDSQHGTKPDDVQGAETGLCFFADNQVDRSPTGSCVAARMALAHAKGDRPVGKRWAYNSLVSNYFGSGAFTAEIVEEGIRVEGSNGPGRNAVVVRVEGRAYYTGMASFIAEKGDVTSENGFTMKHITQ